MLKITVLRHPNAEKALAPGHEAEMARAVSSKGIAQVAARKTEMGESTFDLVLSSPAVRCQVTAAAIGGQVPVLVDALAFEGPDTQRGAALGRAFSELGYAPLSAYRVHSEGRVAIEVGNIAWAEAYGEIAKQSARNVLMVSHAVLSTAMGIAALHGMLSSDAVAAAAELEELNLGECEGYTLEFTQGQQVRLTVHR